MTHPNWPPVKYSAVPVIDPPLAMRRLDAGMIFVQREGWVGMVREGFYLAVQQPPMPEPKDMRAPGSPQGSRCGKEG